MTAEPLSVVVVSRHRAEALTRCLLGLSQQDHPRMEVIVVADPQGLAAVTAQGLTVKTIPFDKANISAARNAGLAAAAGTVTAFIDDDAVPEPTWASRLCAPFADGAVVAATGFVRGRNGISFQWKASEVDALAQDHPLDVDESTLSLHKGTSQRAVKTQGTNCAFRTAVLRAIGGFDPAFRFYLDEADVNLRIADRGLIAVVPLAQVYHGFAASARRRPDRVPVTLHDIGASSAAFLRRHSPAQITKAKALLLMQQRQRALGHMVAGRIEPRDVGQLMSSLEAGWQDGMARELGRAQPLVWDGSPFHALPQTGPRPGRVIAGRSWQRKRLMSEARTAVAMGQIATVFLLEPGFRRHWHQLHPAGFWLQTGGLWGKSDRTARRLPIASLRARVLAEIERLRATRPTEL